MVSKIIKIYYLNGENKEIEYIDIDNLKEKLTIVLEEYLYEPQYVRLILDKKIINEHNKLNFNFYNITNFKSELNENDYIQVIICEKKELFYIQDNNEKYKINPICKYCFLHGKISYILNELHELDYYYMILNVIHHYYNYDIVNNSSYSKLIILAIKHDTVLINNISTKITNDKDIILLAIEENENILEFIGNDMKNNKDIVLSAVNKNGMLLKFASYEMKQNEDIIIAAVRNNGYSLQFASNEFKNNKKIVSIAVAKDSYALQFASKDLKNDKDIILIAVKSDGNSLLYASDNMKNNKYIVLIALNNNCDVSYITNNMKQDKDIILAIYSRTN